MLKIRPDQIEVFKSAALQNFEDQTVHHVEEIAPAISEVIGEAGVRQVVRLGVRRAQLYGLTNRGPVRFYVELMLLFGADFNTDPQLPWAAATLTAAFISDQMERADRLHEKTTAYLAQVAGPNKEYFLEALRRFKKSRFADLPPSGGDVEDALMKAAGAVYPEKCEYLGESSLRGVVRMGADTARRYSLTTNRGAALFVALTLTLGHNFAADPLFPWAAAALNDPHITDPSARAEKLYVNAAGYMSRVLAHSEEQ